MEEGKKLMYVKWAGEGLLPFSFGVPVGATSSLRSYFVATLLVPPLENRMRVGRADLSLQ